MNNCKAEFFVIREIIGAIKRASNTNVGGVFFKKEPFFDRDTERSTVSDWRIEIGTPGIKMRIEMHESHWTMLLSDRPQRSQSNRMVTAQDHWAFHSVNQLQYAGLYLPERCRNIERIAINVASIDDLHILKRGHLECRIVRT